MNQKLITASKKGIEDLHDIRPSTRLTTRSYVMPAEDRPQKEALAQDDLGKVTVNNYSPDVFDNLNQFRDAKQLLARNYDQINTLGHVIVKHKLQSRLGVSLCKRPPAAVWTRV